MARNNNKKVSHWTDNEESFKYFLAADFITQFEALADAAGISQAELAQRMGVTPGRVSQIINNPGNLTIETMVSLSRAIGAKSALVVYNDNDPQNNFGPLSGSIFNECWTFAGSPTQSLSSEGFVGLLEASPGQGAPNEVKFDGIENILSNLFIERDAA